MIERNLYFMRCLILSQYKDLRAGLIWEDFGALTIPNYFARAVARAK